MHTAAMAVKVLVKISGPEAFSVKSRHGPSLRPIFGPKATQKTEFMIRNKAIKKRQANATEEVPGGQRGKEERCGESIGKAEKKRGGYILLAKETRVTFVCLHIHKASFLGAVIGHGRFRGGKAVSFSFSCFPPFMIDGRL